MWASVVVGSWALELGFSSCGIEAAPRHMGSSRTRDQTSMPCIATWIRIHWITREAHGADLTGESPSK